ncbi:MAG: efflux RND transporter periplasmic adaptor subunit [Cellvibrionaceae bacterium]|nr:efflux RND transporter periplasmic adaptor subunit [Cellvibrionaceae bacterium]
MNLEKNLGKLQLVLVVAFVVAALAISKVLQSSYELPSNTVRDERIVTVETRQLEPQDYRIKFSTSGVVAAKANVEVIPQVGGRIKAIHPQLFQGGSFAAGEVLFRIDTREFELSVRQREADLQRAEANLALAKAEVVSATQNWRSTHGDKPIPPLVAREPQLQSARAEVASAEAALDNAKLQLERCEFKLPFPGRVLRANLSEGQVVAAGQSYGEVFSAENLEVGASLDEKQLQWLISAASPKIELKYSLFGENQVRQGLLARGAASLDPSTRFASISFAFAETNLEVIPGVFVEVQIEGKQLPNIIRLPPTAMQSDGSIWQEKDGELAAWQPEILYQTAAEIIVTGDSQAVNVVTSRLAGGFTGMKVAPVIPDEVIAND